VRVRFVAIVPLRGVANLLSAFEIVLHVETLIRRSVLNGTPHKVFEESEVP
jgi:hypothetical protein